MTNDLAYRLTKLVIGALVLNLFVMGYVFYTSYEERTGTVTNQRAACERGKLDRNTNAEGWRIASEARRRGAQYVVAQKYADIALGLENRGSIGCANAFPKASLIP